jgi:putative ubiquitin-RnfH superfamily antitoxin RatB of RatAB toxin-antitoxin module
MPSLLHVEVCYASPTQQCLLSVDVPENSLVRDAIKISGILARFPELELEQLIVGVFSKKCSLASALNDGDRIEIYRPLTIDPKVARRLRAEKNKKRLLQAAIAKRRSDS